VRVELQQLPALERDCKTVSTARVKSGCESIMAIAPDCIE
jgi:hypothetical protein